MNGLDDTTRAGLRALARLVEDGGESPAALVLDLKEGVLGLIRAVQRLDAAVSGREVDPAPWDEATPVDGTPVRTGAMRTLGALQRERLSKDALERVAGVLDDVREFGSMRPEEGVGAIHDIVEGARRRLRPPGPGHIVPMGGVEVRDDREAANDPRPDDGRGIHDMFHAWPR